MCKRNVKYTLQEKVCDLPEKVYDPMLGKMIYNFPRKEDQLVGLLNLSLSCYMNSILQCLFSIKEFREYLLNNTFFKDQPMYRELQELMKNLLNSTKSFYVQTNFKKFISSKNSLFEGNWSRDAKDLLLIIIDSLSEENKKEEEIISEKEVDYNKEIEVYNNAIKEINKKNIIDTLFIDYYESIYEEPYHKDQKI